MQLVASKPTVTVPNTQVSGLGNVETKIGEVTVVADAKGNIKLNTIVFNVTTAGSPVMSIVGGETRLADGSTTVVGSSCAGMTATGGTVTCTFGTTPNGYTLSADTSKTFSLFAKPTAVAGTAGTVSVSSSVTSVTWDDVVGGGTNLTANNANIQNFPTSSFSVRN
jgi:hypothetical protein